MCFIILIPTGSLSPLFPNSIPTLSDTTLLSLISPSTYGCWTSTTATDSPYLLLGQPRVSISLPNLLQRNLAFGAAISIMYPSTVVRSLSEAPKYASAITIIIKTKDAIFRKGNENISIQAKIRHPKPIKKCVELFGLAEL
ncbi:lycopene epsilon cyclase, chloroplastic-like [Amaranthus tricolor]|uniref:lycopene epsilon cyclase, chloroplastic-like n=1 Tax=Amaranthus tricolor TaxID=29722 RepID=UPI0025889128|nr:lycopene epsilon cyclase, chloroplastic-like [Amaranthus tricolor]